MVKHRIQSMAECIKREHHKNVRKLKTWALNNKVSVHDFSNASNDDVCVLSLNEYDLDSYRSDIYENNESYFLDEESAQKYKEYG